MPSFHYSINFLFLTNILARLIFKSSIIYNSKSFISFKKQAFFKKCHNRGDKLKVALRSFFQNNAGYDALIGHILKYT